MKKILKYWYLIVFVIILVFCLFIDNFGTRDIVEEVKSIKEEKVEEKNNIYVDIKGEVKKPGVYEVENNKRIIDVINIAGGLTSNADVSLLNLSKKVSDEMNIRVYSKKEIEKVKERLNEPTIVEVLKEVEKECVCPDANDACDKVLEIDSDDNNSKVNINTASKEELMSISGLGESKADNIIKYRETNKFSKIEDMLNVSGIGEALFEKIKDYIEI